MTEIYILTRHISENSKSIIELFIFPREVWNKSIYSDTYLLSEYQLKSQIVKINKICFEYK